MPTKKITKKVSKKKIVKKSVTPTDPFIDFLEKTCFVIDEKVKELDIAIETSRDLEYERDCICEISDLLNEFTKNKKGDKSRVRKSRL